MASEIKEMNIYEKLSNIQNELKAPKNLYNSFAKFSYRSAETILEAVKPICAKYRAVTIINDELISFANEAFVKSTVTLFDTDSKEKIQVQAFSGLDFNKKGMDKAQCTGTSSSYARKYALNGMFCIDDNKDSDAEEVSKATDEKKKEVLEEITTIKATMNEKNIDWHNKWNSTLLKKAKVSTQDINTLNVEEMQRLIEAYKALIEYIEGLNKEEK